MFSFMLQKGIDRFTAGLMYNFESSNVEKNNRWGEFFC